jgi:hypothetical protein
MTSTLSSISCVSCIRSQRRSTAESNSSSDERDVNALSNNGVWATWEGMISPAASQEESVSKMAVVICAVRPDISFGLCPLQ